MIALLVALAGIAWIVDARSVAERLLLTAVWVCVAAEALSCLVKGYDGVLGDHAFPTTLAVGFLTLALVGYVAWRTRAARGRLRDSGARRHGSPRDRQLPAPPVETEDGP